MSNFISTLLISGIPAVITAFVTYIIASKKIKSSIKQIELSNKHDIEKLMEQHKLDIESLKEKHSLELIAKQKAHEQNVEIIKLNHENEIAKSKEIGNDQNVNNLASGFLLEALKNPDSLNNLGEIKKLVENLKKD